MLNFMMTWTTESLANFLFKFNFLKEKIEVLHFYSLNMLAQHSIGLVRSDLIAKFIGKPNNGWSNVYPTDMKFDGDFIFTWRVGFMFQGGDGSMSPIHSVMLKSCIVCIIQQFVILQTAYLSLNLKLILTKYFCVHIIFP